ncbi:hypothetical protein J1N35_014128 [Gossypium stocksii]|uniref:Uncharacterized protein n=1 Tax=Gossypium stocksii TaxID=47602 RepID=A0A9D4A9M2_9ROSI|nr:hypothetical protein J1N35_014128 [Gossypium stocksii]
MANELIHLDHKHISIEQLQMTGSDRDGLVARHIFRAGNNSTERIRYVRAYILEMIGGYLMPDLSRNLVHLRWLLKLVDFRAAGKFS